MARKKKNKGGGGGGKSGGGSNAAAAASSTAESSVPPLSDETAIAKDVVLNEDAERAIEAAAAATVASSASTDSASPTAGGVSSSFQAGLANALRGIKKAAGLGDIQDQTATDGAANSGGVDIDTSSVLSNNPKTDKSRFGKPLTNDALKEMVDQAVANPDDDDDDEEEEDEPTPSDAKAKAIVDPPPPQRSGKKRDATGGWKVTKTVAGGKTHLALSAPLKPPAPDAAADSAPDFNEKLAIDNDVDADIGRIDRGKPQISASGQPKSILKNKMAATAVKTSALSNNDGGIDADAVSDDGVIDIDRENNDFDDEEVDSDGVVGVCLHCSRPRTKSKQIKTKSPNDVDVDELVEDALDLSDPTALDSSKRPRAVQVSCDDCHSYICTACHWCHEYQANHEIRVCDRCDAFYCRGCDEMDQCEDCSEVVCGGCSTLMSCKFCGCGLCEDCATACGRCGIVLCSRDAKFAVECDTCRMSYCLVCLASGTKDPCVRCGHRPSKRVEQLVHLRLKSIYKAFKQSGASLGPSKSGDRDLPALEDDFDGKNKSGKAAAAAALARAAGMSNLPSTNKGGKGGGSDDFGPDALAGDVGAVLQAAAAAAAAGDKSNRRSGHGSHDFGGEDTGNDDISASVSANRRGSALKQSISDQFAARTEEEADAAAAALLAELDLDDAKAAASAGKKSKKKKKKERDRAEKAAAEAKAAEEDAEATAAAPEAGKSKKKKKKKKGKAIAAESSLPLPTPKPKKERATSVDDASDASSDEEDLLMLVGGGGGSKQAGKKGPGGKGSTSTPIDSAGQSKTSTPATSNQPSPKASPLLKSKDQKSKSSSSDGPVRDDDADDLSLLTEFVQTRDVAAIEALMESLKGVPGKAAIRKNAKKALKKLKEELGPSYSAPSFAPPPPKKKEQEWVENKSTSKSKSKTRKDEPNSPAVANDTPDTVADADQYRPPEPLLKLVSQTHRTVKDETGKGADHSTPRTETVLHMSPLVVGWVIGRGGTRIRDLMEDSGAKIWIDQDSMGPKEARVVYISGPRKSVDSAVRSMKDLVAKAPVGGGSGLQPSSPSTSAKSGASSVPAKPLTPAAPTSSSTTPTKAAVAAQKAATPVAPSTPAVPAATPPTSFAKAAAASAPVPVPAQASTGVTAPPTSVPTPSIVPPAATATVSTPAVQTLSTSTSKNGVHSHSLTCEPRFVPLLIGRRGWTVKHIQDATGARVDIDQSVSPRKIVVSSSDEAAVKSAVRMVRDVLNYPHAVEGDQKEKEMAIDGAAAELAAKIQAQAQAQAMAALLAQQQQLAAGQPLAVSQPQAASFLAADSQPSGIPNTKTPLFPQHVARSAAAGAGGPSYANNASGAMQYQDHRPTPQSQLDQRLSGGLDGGIASIQQSMTQLQLQAAQQKLQRQQLLLEQQQRLLEQQARNRLPPGIGGGVPPQGSLGVNPTTGAATATGADANAGVGGDAGLGLMANATAPEFSANAPAFQARNEPSSSGVASLSSSYHAASTANSSNVAQGSIFSGLSGSTLLAGGSIPTQQQQQSTGQQHDALGVALGETGAPTTASERDIIDDIFGSMGAGMAGGTDTIAGLGGGAPHWGATGLSGWGTTSNSDTFLEGQQPPSGSASSTGATLQSLIGGFVGGQQQQEQNNWDA